MLVAGRFAGELDRSDLIRLPFRRKRDGLFEAGEPVQRERRALGLVQASREVACAFGPEREDVLTA